MHVHQTWEKPNYSLSATDISVRCHSMAMFNSDSYTANDDAACYKLHIVYTHN